MLANADKGVPNLCAMSICWLNLEKLPGPGKLFLAHLSRRFTGSAYSIPIEPLSVSVSVGVSVHTFKH